MSVNCAKLCSILIGESFGVVLRKVADVMLTKGPSCLSVIVAVTDLPPQAVRDALKTLIQHFIVSFSTSTKNPEVYYTVKYEHTLEFMRYPKYLLHAEKSTGAVAREILEEVVKAGSLPISKLVYICGYRVKKSNPDISEETLLEQLVLFKNTIQNLALRRYIILDPGPYAEIIRGDFISKESFAIPDVDHKLIFDKLLEKTELKLEELPDSNILWRINIKQFHAELRNILVYQAIERKYKSMMDPRILQVIIDFGFEKHPWEKDGNPISAAEITDRILKMEGGDVTANFITEHFEIMEEDPKKLVSKLSNSQGGHFSFNMKTAVFELVWSTIDGIITERHGFFALRIFRLVRDKGFAEQDQINELGLIPAKDCKHLTYKLVEDHFLRIKEIRKAYNTTAPPGKVTHVFYVDINQVVRCLREYCYKAIVNLKQRIKSEKDKTKRLITKEERISRILINMTNKKCSEEQMKEIRELITPPETNVLMMYQFSNAKMTSGTMHVDETLFVIQLFMHYHKRTPK